MATSTSLFRQWLFVLGAICPFLLQAQTPVPMPSQPMLTYIETFDSIATWGNDFVSGHGANRFTSVAIGGTAAIPDPNRITTNSNSFITASMSAGGLYKDTVNGRLMMLVTGTSNNTNALAIDFHCDFTGINAGSLSFDWETIFNGASNSNRQAVLKVYASTNGSNFTELTTASVTITNYVAANGSVVQIPLPTSFNNSATARLRFYYYNAAGGSTGSRPAIALDNIKITASGAPCSTPLAAPTALSFPVVTATTIQGLFSPASPQPDEYLVVATDQSALHAIPADSTVYHVGDIIGDGTVIYRGRDTFFTATQLNPLTTYTFYIFSSNIYCNGSNRYLSSTPLTGIQTTPAGPPCVAPTQQPTNLQFNTVTTSSIHASFSPSPDATEYLVVQSLNSSLTSQPINTHSYHIGDTMGGGEVVYRGGATHFTALNLQHSTTYHYFVYGLNNFACSNGPVYLTTNPLSAAQNTKALFPCVAPYETATQLLLQPNETRINGFFHAGNPNTDGFLVVMSTASSLTALPQNGSHYTIGSNVGGGTIISSGKNYSFTSSGLQPNTPYYFFVFPYNDVCIGGPIYQATNYLQGNVWTLAAPPAKQYYFGNLHSHSAYSDGNKDDITKTPWDDYAFAQNALCMDFLGISDHNHYTAPRNPGMLLPNYAMGLQQADSFTNNHSGFLALYGMEWGTQTNGGHSLVYGIDSLIGWETVSGNPNYNIYVPKNDYSSTQGLFQTVNKFTANNAFVSLAHPSFNDYQNLASMPYNAAFDSAIVGVALESGPAFSTDTNYMSPGSNMQFLPYYLQLLSKGYHVAPMIDHDNHNMTFGRTAQTRTAVITQSISKSSFLQAIKNRSFYATQDGDTRVQYSIYGTPMGGMKTHELAPAIHIHIEDPTQTSDTPIIRLYSGIPGSGVMPTEITSKKDFTLNYTDITLPAASTAYYYADILWSGKRTLSAPIWYTRAIDPPLSVQPIQPTNATAYQVSIIQNPVDQELQLHVTTEKRGKMQVVVYTLTGQLVLKTESFIHPDKTIYRVTLPELPVSMYLLETTFEGIPYRYKWTKK